MKKNFLKVKLKKLNTIFNNSKKLIIKKYEALKEYLNKVNIDDYAIMMTLFCVFISPTFFLENLFKIDITKYLFFAFSLLAYIAIIIKTDRIEKCERIMLIIIPLICIIQRSIVPLSLIELLLVYRVIDYLIDSKEIISNKQLLISSIGVVFYTLIYFNFNGRFMYTGLREINQSSFAILMLALLIRNRNKKIGNIILMLGLLTFSRNYLLGLAVFIILELIKNTKVYAWLYNFFSFKRIVTASIIILVLLASIFELAYKNDKLVEYKEGFERYVYIFDYSNYFRFTTNTNLVKMYYDNPQKLLTGIEEKEFYDYTYQLVKANGGKYRAIKPHNYFFSYFRIYGFFSLAIFWFLNKIMDKIINKNNFSVFISIFVYSILLGIGFTNYWIFLSALTLLICGKEVEKDV